MAEQVQYSLCLLAEDSLGPMASPRGEGGGAQSRETGMRASPPPDHTAWSVSPELCPCDLRQVARRL